MRTLFSIALVAAFGLSLAACDSAGSDSVGTANLTVRMTDAPFPFDLASEANVTITRIELLAGDDDSAGDTTATDSTDADREDRIVLYDGEPFDLNLLDLRNGIDTTLVESFSIPADGSYRQLRFFVGDDANVVFNDGTVYNLKLPSAQSSGIKVMLPDFDAEGDDVDVLIDFDVEKSFVVRGNIDSADFNGFLFKPVLEIETFAVDRDADGSEDGGSDEEESDGDEPDTDGSDDGSDG